jgi:hypothetical protein
VLVLELSGTEITECRMQTALVVDFLDEARKVLDDVLS